MNSELESKSSEQIRLSLRSARIQAQRSMKACADLLQISIERFAGYEQGALIPSLPEIELLSYYFKTPLLSLICEDQQLQNHDTSLLDGNSLQQFISLRHKLIGAKLKLLRQEKQISPAQLAEMAGFPEDDLQDLEFGRTPIRISILCRIVKALDCSLLDIIDHETPIGQWQQDQATIETFTKLSDGFKSALLKNMRPQDQLFLTQFLTASEEDRKELIDSAELILSSSK